jgi:peptidoglycan/LPS O-acetylase OafA/YrhL
MSSEELAAVSVPASETGSPRYAAPAVKAKDHCAAACLAIDLGGHLPALDGLRGVAILMVMLFHFFPWDGAGADFIYRWWPFFASQLSKCVLFGMYGVDLFFVLSGFLITGILLDTKELPGFFRNFYARRFLRIFPLYYGALIGAFLVWPLFTPRAHASLGTQLWYWLYASNMIMPEMLRQHPPPLWISGGVFSLGQFWSLAIEEQFYLVWPVLIFVCRRQGVVRLAVLCLTAAPLARIALLAMGRGDYVHWFTLARLDPIAIGALLAVVLRNPAGRALVAKLVPWCLAASAALTLLIVMALSHRLEYPSVVVLKYSVFAVFFGSLMAYLLLFGRSAIAWCFRWRVLRFFGKYSYGLYVFHCLFMHLSALDGLDRTMHSELLGLFAQLVIPAAGATLVAFASYHLYEKHFLRLKRHFTSPRLIPG